MEFKLKASSDLEIKNEIIQSLNSLNQNELMSLKNYLQNRNVIHIIEEKSNQKSLIKIIKNISIKKNKKINKKKKKNNQIIKLGLLKRKNIKNDIPIILLN